MAQNFVLHHIYDNMSTEGKLNKESEKLIKEKGLEGISRPVYNFHRSNKISVMVILQLYHGYARTRQRI